jgi:electron transfer flavoprotein alpha subunit
VIVEAEAYSQVVPACHGYRRRSPSNETLFGEPGRFYIYVSYGIHHCVNVVTDRAGWANGVLLRSVALPGEQERIGAGPALLARRFALDRAWDATAATNVVSLPDSGFNVKRSIFTGKAFETVALSSERKIISVRKNAVAVTESPASGELVSYQPTLTSKAFAIKTISTEKTSGEVLLSDAEIVVSGGRGLKGPENWALITDMAKVLGAATGCSKPVSDLHWRPHHEHVGQTGIKVSPNLYFAIGISGAIQHVAGISSSKVIVAINKDADAPIFKVANYGIVGDAFEIVPKLTQALREAL